MQIFQSYHSLYHNVRDEMEESFEVNEDTGLEDDFQDNSDNSSESDSDTSSSDSETNNGIVDVFHCKNHTCYRFPYIPPKVIFFVFFVKIGMSRNSSRSKCCFVFMIAN